MGRGERAYGLLQRSDVLRPHNPTLFLLGGVSGAGLTTAYKTVLEQGFGVNPAPQFMSRPYRPDEVRGTDNYSVTKETLEKIYQQVAVQHALYDTKYGYFLPGITQIKRALQFENVIIDIVGTQSDWRRLLGVEQNIVSIFFAPNHPVIAVNRIIARTERTGATITTDWVQRRVNDGRDRIEKTVWDYDYLLDTSDLSKVTPMLKSIIVNHSSQGELAPQLISIESQRSEVEKFIQRYQTNLKPYIEVVC